MPDSILGKGVKHPFNVSSPGDSLTSSGGGVAPSSEEQHVRESVRQILGTRLGERPGRRSFGSALFNLVFEPNDIRLRNRLNDTVVRALARWEPRIKVNGLRVLSEDQIRAGGDPSQAIVIIAYEIIRTGRQDRVAIRVRGQ